MADSLEEFNKHQQDLTNRASSFVGMLFVLAGGALSISIAVFTGQGAPSVNPGVAVVLGVSWWCLVASVVLLCAMLTTIILRDYCFGERWRRHLHDPSREVDDRPSWPDKLMVGFGLVGVIAFMLGFLGLAYVATALLRIA